MDLTGQTFGRLDILANNAAYPRGHDRVPVADWDEAVWHQVLAIKQTGAEAIETTRIHRVTGLTGDRTACVTTLPLRAPHHTISDVGLIGGGQVPMPGEVSLAHHGALFLDELPSACAMSWRCCVSRLRRVLQEYNFAGVLDPVTLMALVKRLQVRIP